MLATFVGRNLTAHKLPSRETRLAAPWAPQHSSSISGVDSQLPYAAALIASFALIAYQLNLGIDDITATIWLKKNGRDIRTNG